MYGYIQKLFTIVRRYEIFMYIQCAGDIYWACFSNDGFKCMEGLSFQILR